MDAGTKLLGGLMSPGSQQWSIAKHPLYEPVREVVQIWMFGHACRGPTLAVENLCWTRRRTLRHKSTSPSPSCDEGVMQFPNVVSTSLPTQFYSIAAGSVTTLPLSGRDNLCPDRRLSACAAASAARRSAAPRNSAMMPVSVNEIVCEFGATHRSRTACQNICARLPV